MPMELSTSEVQDAVYKSHNEHYSDAHSMWQSLSRNVDEATPGIEKAGYGKWRYSGDKETLQAIQSN